MRLVAAAVRAAAAAAASARPPYLVPQPPPCLHPFQRPAQVNNAGVYFKTYDADSHARTLNTNLDGAVGVALALLPHLAHGARIVNVSSGARAHATGRRWLGHTHTLGVACTPARRRAFAF
jgi:NAD(P)-dependent dehydrogenase (short-subunit alcohol dehydrogenase family)